MNPFTEGQFLTISTKITQRPTWVSFLQPRGILNLSGRDKINILKLFAFNILKYVYKHLTTMTLRIIKYYISNNNNFI